MQMTVMCNICGKLLITVEALPGTPFTDLDIAYYQKAMMCQTDGNNGTNIVAEIIDGS